jgi:hypothetical protein
MGACAVIPTQKSRKQQRVIDAKRYKEPLLDLRPTLVVAQRNTAGVQLPSNS